MNVLDIFAGAGGGILGGQILGWRTVCAVERDAYAAAILAQRQNDGHLEPFPVWSDVETFDGRPWRGIVDVVAGGFPCQDISCAGTGEGITGSRSGLWVEMARIISEVRPQYALVENSPMLTSRGLGTVLGDLAEMGYDARWGVLGADDVGAPHIRKRIWIVADANAKRRKRRSRNQRQKWWLEPQNGSSRHTHRQRLAIRKSQRSDSRQELAAIERADWWKSEPDVGRVANGVANRVDRLRCIGNGQVPQCMAEAWRILSEDEGVK